MIRLMLILLILAFVASKLYDLPVQPEVIAPPTPTIKPGAMATPLPTPTPKPTTGHAVVAGNAGGVVAVPLPPIPPTPGAPDKVATGLGKVLVGIGETIRDVTTAMVDDGDETSRATCGLLGIVWTALGFVGIAALRFIGKILGGLLG